MLVGEKVNSIPPIDYFDAKIISSDFPISANYLLRKKKVDVAIDYSGFKVFIIHLVCCLVCRLIPSGIGSAKLLLQR
jgi:hypothetical protein